MQTAYDPGRRTLLRGGAALVAGLVLAGPSALRAATRPPASRPRSLSFVNAHTDETLTAEYWRGGRYEPEALKHIDHILRDHRSGEVAEIDRGLLDLLHDLKARVGASRPFHVISGYRSPATNAKLHQNSSGVAPRSLHLEGRAIDIRLPRIKLHDLRDAALELRRGGVGYYPASDFVHVDVGRVRRW